MMERMRIQTPTPYQKAQMITAFTETFGMPFNRMTKEQLALMIMNQSTNVNNISNEAGKVVQIGIRMKSQRDWFLKLIRKKYLNKA